LTTILLQTEINVEEACHELIFRRQEPMQQFATSQHRLWQQFLYMQDIYYI